MTENKLKNLVAEAVSLDREKTNIETRLTEIKEALITEARTRADEYTPTAAGGWSWIAVGRDGCIARVTQEGPKLKASISTDKDVDKAKTLAGRSFNILFDPRVSYRLTAGFREEAEATLGTTEAKKLVKALTSPGAVKVSYETKEVA